MGLIGCDAPALFSFASQLRERKRNIERATQKLGLLVQEANWVGPDRDEFIAQWSELHAPGLIAVCENLSNAASKAVRAAQKQQHASSR